MPVMLDRELGDLAECRISLARLLDCLGDHERAGTILQANLRMCREVPAETGPVTVKSLEHRTRQEILRHMEQFALGELRGFWRGGLGPESRGACPLDLRHQ
jgi:hypothetical protein